jgi:hypothetical protein
MIAHDYQYSHTVPATCTAVGKKVYACVCGKEQNTTLPLLDHDYQLVSTVAATQASEGSQTYACKACGRSYTEIIPKLPPAYMTEYCTRSLLGKALPNTKYYSYMGPIMDRYAAKLTREQSLAMGLLAMPSYCQRDDFVNEFRVIYRYMYFSVPHAVYSDPATDTAQFLAWSPAAAYQLLESCYDEVYRILDELGINDTTSKYEAICRINDYLCEAKFYQTAADQNMADYHNNSTFFSIFASGANCHNYSIAFQMLCLGAGIECHYYPSETMNHAWNLVYLEDGSSYWVDVCWNDMQYRFSDGRVVETSVANGVPAATVKRLRETYLLITTEKLLEDHSL